MSDRVKKQITPEGKYWRERIRSKDLEINSLQEKLKELKEELNGWVSLTTQSSTDYIPHVIREHITKSTCAERDQLRTALDNMTEVARLAQEAAATAETRAVTHCADLADSSCGCKLDDDRCCGPAIKTAIKKEYGL